MRFISGCKNTVNYFIMSFIVEYENSYTVNVHKVKLNLDINTTNCEDHSANCSNSCKLFRILPITIPLKDSEIKGDVFIHKGIRDWASRHRKPNELNFELILYNVKRFEVDAKLNFSCLSPPLNTTILRSGDVSKPMPNQQLQAKGVAFQARAPTEVPKASWKFSTDMEIPSNQTDYTFDISLKGSLSMKIDCIQESLRETTMNIIPWISKEVISEFESETNFTFICDGETFYFNKTLLCLVSGVFKRMIERQSNEEAISNSVEIEDVSAETIRAFQRVAFGMEEVKDEDFSIDLLMFANKYLIEPLVAKCKDQIIGTLNNEDVFDVIKAAYLINDEEMLMAASKHLKKNLNELKNSEEWLTFEKSNPTCMNKVLRKMFLE